MSKFKVKNYINLASPILGTKIYSYSDQFFGAASRMLNENSPIFKENVYDKHGKWMDGWETRRKRIEGNDFCIIKLGKAGKVSVVEIDTSFFNGNQPEYASLDVCFSNTNKFKWKNILKKKKLKPNAIHKFKISKSYPINFAKLNIFPDGGVARLRLYGSIAKSKKSNNKKINLASLLDGASVIACNNEHFGKAENILAPGKAKNMGDGWETRRRRGKGNDWLILNSIDGNSIDKIEISTHHFKGNYPSYCSLQAAYLPSKSPRQIVNSSNKWKFLLKNTKLSANKTHKFKNSLMKNKKINYIKINIFPDGGISRFKIFGKKI